MRVGAAKTRNSSRLDAAVALMVLEDLQSTKSCEQLYLLRGNDPRLSTFYSQMPEPMSNPPTQKEERIIALVAQGLKNSEIARVIGATQDAAKNCLKIIFDKTGMWSRLELALWYLKGI